MRNKQAITPYYGMALIALLMIFSFGCTNISGSDVKSKKSALSESEMETSIETARSSPSANASDAGVSKDSGIQDSGTGPQMDGGMASKRLFSDEAISLDSESREAKIIENVYTDSFVNERRVVKINYNVLTRDQISMNLFSGKNILVNKRKANNRGGPKDMDWFGVSEDPYVRVVITAVNGLVEGSVWIGAEQFWIRPLGSQYHLIIDVDESELEDPPCLTEDKKISADKLDGGVFSEEAGEEKGYRSGGQPTRILIVYANSAENYVNNTLGTTMSARALYTIAEMNDAFDNSNISHEVELARVYKTDYDETCVKYGPIPPGECMYKLEDLCYFALDDDEVMDEIHQIRSDVDADICVLFRHVSCSDESQANGGQAWTIEASGSTEAFAVVEIKQSYGPLHFAHEVGHLYGCRHQTENPQQGHYEYAYHRNNGGSCQKHYRTIVSVPCAAGGCEKVKYFSNPNLDHPQDSNCPLGVSDVNECYHKINDTAPDIEDFYSPPSILALPMDEQIENEEYVFFYATDFIQNWMGYWPTDYEVKSGGTAYFKADEIHFFPGFHAHSGSIIRAGKDIILP